MNLIVDGRVPFADGRRGIPGLRAEGDLPKIRENDFVAVPGGVDAGRLGELAPAPSAASRLRTPPLTSLSASVPPDLHAADSAPSAMTAQSPRVRPSAARVPLRRPISSANASAPLQVNLRPCRHSQRAEHKGQKFRAARVAVSPEHAKPRDGVLASALREPGAVGIGRVGRKPGGMSEKGVDVPPTSASVSLPKSRIMMTSASGAWAYAKVQAFVRSEKEAQPAERLRSLFLSPSERGGGSRQQQKREQQRRVASPKPSHPLASRDRSGRILQIIRCQYTPFSTSRQEAARRVWRTRFFIRKIRARPAQSGDAPPCF